ncbi:hypothetical protein DFJ58DRAFT_743344 [Suillus subalutaceus]|uniref:uncharacterized protein n=1 Tax=Suillus subalutaceus TaxID=48586 RepID=UPI001B86BB34|nr:uncharacterized protein DFJ58DRAFT_743344 [Suillus subalutaceus]KAG1865544.1 hypothetical protein DFJ58DRAFT_743344 [Suillus subalutaceus]
MAASSQAHLWTTLHDYGILTTTNGKLLATGCYDKNAYTWNVSAILKEAGLDDLLLDKPDKSLLAADATRRPVRQPIKISPQVPRGFFDDTSNRAHLSGPHSLSSPSHRSTLLSRFLSYSAPYTPIHTIRHPDLALSIGFETVSLPDKAAQISSYTSVPQQQLTSRMPRGNVTVTQQSSGTAQAQSSSQSHAAVSTVPPVVSNTTSSTPPHVTIKYPARWTRFWLFICCASPEYTDGHP